MNRPLILKITGPFVFNPRVKPDPAETERLEAKFRDAAQRFTRHGHQPVQKAVETHAAPA